MPFKFQSVDSDYEVTTMIRKIKNWFKRHIDYKIVGEYYDSDGKGRYIKKYNKKYYFKKGE